MSEYLDLPISINDIINKKDIKRVDLKKSIQNMIHLITTSAYNEVRHDPFFGTEIWKYDFENIYNTHILKDELKKSVLNSIRNNEKRLNHVNIDIQIDQVEFGAKFQNRRVKTQIILNIDGVIDKTNEKLKLQETFFIGPLSY